MLHVRVVSPPGATDGARRAAFRRSGVRNLVVMPGAARRPDGDAVQFDLLTRFANPVLRNCAPGCSDVKARSSSRTSTRRSSTGPGRPGE